MATRRKRSTYSPNAERRAVLYARYSSENQRDSWSIEAQISDLRVYCERMGWRVLDEVCIDEAITGKTEERPGLERAMSLIREGRANVLVVHKLDRFFRNMAKTFEYVAELEDCGAGLVCTQQPIDTTNPVSGKIVLAVMSALAEIYLDNLAEEVSKGKRARAAAGLPNGDLPFGYALPPADPERPDARRVPQPVAAEAGVVRAAFELCATGQYGDAQIARLLNDRGHRMRSKRQPQGGRFNKDSMRHLLTNRFYAGQVVQPLPEGGNWAVRAREAQWVRGMHEPIIDPAAFEQVQAVRRSRAAQDARGSGRRGPVTDSPHAPYLARGIARCRVCGHRLWGQAAANRRAHYRCNVTNRGGDCAAGRKSIPADLVDAALGAAIGALRLPQDWRDAARAAIDDGGDRAEAIASQRAALERKLARLKALLIDGDLSQADYRAERSRIEAELARLAPPERQAGSVEQAAALLDDLAALWEAAEVEERRQIAAQAIEALYCDLDRPGEMVIHLKPTLHPLLPALPPCIQRVTDGARTHNHWSHNPVLYH